MPYRSPNQRAVTPQGRGRFPGYDVLEEAHRWDDVTAGVVLARLAPITDLSFFTMAENAVVTALCDHLLAQDSDPRIPVVALIDTRLALGETDGWHYDDLPEDGQAWRDTLRYLDDDAGEAHGATFDALSTAAQAALVQQVQDRSTRSARWHNLPATQVWSLWVRYACTAFYSHPWAWNEIGFGGPAYPRGYKNRHAGGREPWEVADHDDADPVT
jgi:Gluconate 2-dehydrogenase subunit 3